MAEPNPELVPVFELVAVFSSGGGEVWHFDTRDDAVAFAKRLGPAKIRIQYWLQTRPDTVLDWVQAKTTLVPVEAPDPALVQKLTAMAPVEAD